MREQIIHTGVSPQVLTQAPDETLGSPGGREHLLFYRGNSGWAPGGTVTRETKPRLEAWNSQPCSLLFSKKGSQWSEWSPRSMWWSLQKIPKTQGPELPGGQAHPHPRRVSEWNSLSCVWLCDPMDYTAHGILQARILEWVAFPLSRGSSQPRDQTQVSHIAGRFFTYPTLQADSLPAPQGQNSCTQDPQISPSLSLHVPAHLFLYHTP